MEGTRLCNNWGNLPKVGVTALQESETSIGSNTTVFLVGSVVSRAVNVGFFTDRLVDYSLRMD